MTTDKVCKIYRALITVYPSEAMEILTCLAKLLKDAKIKLKNT